MKQLYILTIAVLLFLGNNKLKAQEWFPVGAEYTYTHYETTFSSFGPIIYPFHMSVIGLDTINGFPFKQLNYSMSDLSPHEYIGFRNDSVCFFDPRTNSVELLFDLSKTVGDSFDIRFSNFNTFIDSTLRIDTIRIHIDSIEIISLNNVSARKFNISIEGLSSNDYCIDFFNQEFIEYIGYTDWMFSNICQIYEMSIGNLRCYENDSLGLVKFVNYSCDSVATPVGIKDITQNEVNFSAYPNPSKEFITLELNEALSLKDEAIQLQIVSIDGRIIQQQKVVFNNNKTTINIESINKGVYFVKVFLQDGTNVVSKIVVK